MVLYAKDIVETDFLLLPPTTSALEAAKKMKAARHGFVVVSDAQGRPEGIVTEWDFLAKITAEGVDPATLTLEQLMTRELIKARAEDSIEAVAQVMTRQGVRRLLVEKDGMVVGVITAATIMRRLKEYVDRVTTSVARFQGPWV